MPERKTDGRARERGVRGLQPLSERFLSTHSPLLPLLPLFWRRPLPPSIVPSAHLLFLFSLFAFPSTAVRSFSLHPCLSLFDFLSLLPSRRFARPPPPTRTALHLLYESLAAYGGKLDSRIDRIGFEQIIFSFSLYVRYSTRVVREQTVG